MDVQKVRVKGQEEENVKETTEIFRAGTENVEDIPLEGGRERERVLINHINLSYLILLPCQ